MNLETNTVEAKLLDKGEDSKDKALSVIHNENATKNTSESEKGEMGDIKIETVKTITKSMEESLKKLPSDKLEPSKNKFKTLDEIDFNKLKLSAKTDFDIMHELFEKYDKLVKERPVVQYPKDKLDSETVEQFSVEYLDIFADLEYLVHQYDNANEFVRIKGLENIIYPHLNGTDNTLKAEALKVLTACLQNNIKVQIYALETNAGELLLKILSLDNNEYVKGRAIKAIGTLVRGFPVAQKFITSKHAMDVFQNILLSNNPSYFKFKIFILTLLDDLVLEYKLVSEFHTSKPDSMERLRQYREVDLVNKLSNPLFCGILTKLLQEYFDYDKTDLDSIVKITNCITSFVHSCKTYHYRDKKLLATFHKIQSLFVSKLMKNKKGGPDSNESSENLRYYNDILEFIENYIHKLSESQLRDEL